MAESIKNKRISQRYNDMVQQKNAGKQRSGRVFKESLKKTKIKSNKSGPKNYTPVKLGKSRPIDLKHAIRIAKYAPIIQKMAAKHNVPVELICGVIIQESGGNSRARSNAGAKGLMQLMPATAKRFGVKNSYDPVQNIEGGTKYLRYLLEQFNGNVELALAGYNAGEGRVREYGNKIPPFKETREYVPAVLGYTQTMIDILSASRETLPAHARRV